MLLDPKGSLSKVLSSSASYKMVNKEVSKVQETGSLAVELIPYKRGKYLTLTPAQQFEVSKRAAEHDVAAALKRSIPT